MSIPAPIVAAEPPIGVQLVAPPGRDGVLLAGQLERAGETRHQRTGRGPCPDNLTLLMETSGERLG